MEPLTIRLSESTQRKLGAIAVLTGRSYNQILEDASQIVDNLVSEELVRCATSATGRTAATVGYAPKMEPVPLHQQTSVSEESERESSGNSEFQNYSKEEPKEETLFGEFAHGLSDDSDDGEDVSPVVTDDGVKDQDEVPVRAALKKSAPQKEKFVEVTRKSKATLDDALRIESDEIVDVGDDADAFLDATLGEPAEEAAPSGAYSAGYAGVGVRGSRPIAAGKKFNERKPRVRVSEHTGNEE